MQYCSLQHQILLLSPVPFTTGCCFCFGSIPSFFLELFLLWSPVAYWAPTDLGSSSFSVLSFGFFILFIGFARQSHSLLQWTTFCQTSPPWPARLGWPYTAWLIVSFMLVHTHLVPQDFSPLWKTWWCSVVSFNSNVDALVFFFLQTCLYPCYWKCDL